MNPSWVVFVLGLAPLGFFYKPIKAWFGGSWTFVAVAIAYLVALRIVSDLLARRVTSPRDRTPEQVLGEVEILLAYGRRKRAIRELRVAVSKYPEVISLHAKLREIESE